MTVLYGAISSAYKHVTYHPGRYVHVIDVTCHTVDFDYSEKERIDQLVIGSEEPLDISELTNMARSKLLEEHPDFQFYRDVQVTDLQVVEAFDREIA